MKKLAVLIDADNTSHKSIHLVLQEIAKYGVANIKRVYGDWSSEINENGTLSNRLHVWKDVSLFHAITPIQQFAYTKGKDATDMMLIINAMDLLHGNQLDGFCIVSSDSDFTPLASRIRESGLVVYGFGRQQTPSAFINACDKFIYIENLDENNNSVLDEDNGLLQAEEKNFSEDKLDDQSNIDKSVGLNKSTVRKNLEHNDDNCIAQTDSDHKKIASPNQLIDMDEQTLQLIYKAIQDIADDDGWANLSILGNYLVAIKPDFDTRTYGRAKLSGLLQALNLFVIKQENSQKYVKKRKSFAKFLKTIDDLLKTHYGVGQWAQIIALKEKARINPNDFGFNNIEAMFDSINSKYFELSDDKTKIRLLSKEQQ